MPDRAVTVSEVSLQAASFVPHLTQQLTAAVTGSSRSGGSGRSPVAAELSDAGSAAGGSGAIGSASFGSASAAAAAFAADVVARLCRRGHAAAAAAALWPLLQQPAAAAVVSAIADEAARERLLEALLRQLDSSGGDTGSGHTRLVSAFSALSAFSAQRQPAGTGTAAPAAAVPGGTGSLDSFGVAAAALAALIQRQLWQRPGVSWELLLFEHGRAGFCR